MMALIDSVKKALSSFHLNGGSVLVAVSGGADSIALLHLLHRAGVSCGVAYFDHQTRQGASAEDGRFVASAAQTLGLEFYLGGADVAGLAAARGESFEMAARRARYAFLLETARAKGYTAIATGHHGDDQVETVLLRLLRGVSPSGLAGIAPQRIDGGVAIIRPMLGLRRADIIAWLRSEGLEWREDASNQDTDIRRNRVRHVLLPLLVRDFNPGIAEALNRVGELQRMDNALLDTLEATARRECASARDRIDRAAFRGIAPALQFRCMVRWIRAAGGDPDYAIVARAVDFVLQGNSGSQIDLGHGAVLYLGGDHAVFAPLLAGGDTDELILNIPGEIAGLGSIFQIRRLDSPPDVPLAAYCHAARQVFDGAALSGPLVIRRWRAGDRIQPLGMSGSRKLKAVYNDLGLSAPERAGQIVVENGGRIIWVPGYAVAGDAAVTAETCRYVELCIDKAQ